MSIITLTTDFGLKDHFVGSLKGKLISMHPEVQIIDISHEIDLFNIAETSYIINASYNSFPKGTIHLIGVDSEITEQSKPIAMLWNDHYFICADNGILSILTQYVSPKVIVEINYDNTIEKKSSMDVFTVAATQLAKGEKLSSIGKPILELKKVNELQAIVANDKSIIKGYVVYVDHFGNCVTNISKKMFNEIIENRSFEIKFGTKSIKKIHASYSDFKVSDKYFLKDYEGEKLALFNEAGFLEIAIYRSNPLTVGSAKSLLGLKYRDVVNIEFN
jgi:S-adenosylmethionine hydrolase